MKTKIITLAVVAVVAVLAVTSYSNIQAKAMKAENDAALAAYTEASLADCRAYALSAGGIAGSYHLEFKEAEIVEQGNYPAELISLVYQELKGVPTISKFPLPLDEKAFNQAVAEIGDKFGSDCMDAKIAAFTPPNKL